MITKTSYDKMSVADLLSDIRTRQIALPKYQRNVVWSMDKKQRLIDSVRFNFPIGAILLAEVDERDEDGTLRKVYRIIDGLQRTSSFIAFHDNPRNFVMPEWVEENWVNSCEEIFEEIERPTPLRDNLRKALFDFLLSRTHDRLSLFSCLAEISDVSVVEFNSFDTIEELTTKLIEKINKSLDVSSKEIPIIKFVGSAEDQATAFERLNTGSVQLTKYEIAAAMWNKPVRLVSPQIHSQIKKYWKERIDSANLEIDGIADDGTPDQITVFDALIGIGREISLKHPLLVKENKSDSIAFQIAAICLKLRLSEIHSIEDRLPRSRDGAVVEMTNFAEKVLTAAAEIDKALQPVLGLKLTARTIKSQFSDHSELHIASLISHVAIEAIGQSSDWSGQILSRTTSEQDALLGWYLIDRIRSEWGNAGDSTLFNRVWKQVAPDSDYTPNPLYKNRPETATARISLDAWFESEMEREHKERSVISSESKVVLRYFYSPRIPFADHARKEFQLDHLVPIDWWKRLYQRHSGDGAPINSIGNLCLMDIAHHRTKTTQLPFAWYSNNPAIQNKIRENYFLIEPEEIDCVEEIPAGQISKASIKQWLNQFEDMQRSRWAEIRDFVLEKYF
jgi:Protein of unknown function DUF262